MQGIGTIKAVLSGDTVVLVGSAKPGSAPPEMQLSLSHLSAPRVSRHPDTKDEPFGWPAREFLRRHAIGKQVRFRVDYKVEKISRSFATLWLTESPAESVNALVARNGWAKVNPLDAKASPSDEYEELVLLGREAEEYGAGIYNPTPGLGEATVRIIKWNHTLDEANALLSDVAGVPQAAIVEQVANGSTLRVLLTNTTPAHAITFTLAGVAAPKVASTASSTPATTAATAATAPTSGAGARDGSKPGWAKTAAPTAPATTVTAPVPAPTAASGEAAVAAEAKFFVEMRLLHRDVVLHIAGVDKYGNFIGRVEHPAGDIAVELLRTGLAKVADWSIVHAGAAAASLRGAERSAKLERLRLWQNYVPTEIKGEKYYEGKVIEVVSGDTLVVAVPSRTSVPEERRVSLASVRAPRLGNVRREEKDAPYAVEAKEWLRRNVIGREVSVSVDYTRASAAGGDGSEPASERTFATVTYSTKKGDVVNVGLGVVSEGLAEVIKHRGEEDRASNYDELLVAEEACKTAKKNIFSGKEPPVKRITDLSLDASKAKGHFAFLQRAKTMRGIVEHVFAGGRLKVHVPSENCTFFFAISGVRCPAVARPATKGPDGKMRPAKAAEPCGAEALSYLRESLMQQDVELEADEVDKNGAILGPIYIGKGGARKNVATELLRKGLAYGIYPVIEKVRDNAELIAAEAEAKAAKRGVWEHFVEPVPEDDVDVIPAGAGGADTSAPAGVSYGTVCEITDGSTFYVHSDADLAKLASVTAKLDALLKEVGKQASMVEMKKGKVLACLFDDGSGAKWNRARVEGRTKKGDTLAKSADGYDLYDVTYIDYGNKGSVTAQQARPLEPALAGIPPLARECSLYLTRVPALDADYGTDAANLLSECVYGRRLPYKLHARDATGRILVSLWDEEMATSISEELVQAGVARISRQECARIRRKKLAAGDKDFDLMMLLEAAQESAKKRRAGMFAYGDVGGSDDDRR